MDERRESREQDMAEKILVALRDVARKANITPAQAKYWVKLLGVVLVMKGRVGFLDEETSDRLLRMAGLVDGGMSPKAAAFEISGVVHERDLVPVEAIGQGGVDELKDRLDRLEEKNGLVERALVLLAEENRALRGEMARLVESNQALQLRLTPPPLPAEFNAPAKPVKAWAPSKLKDPAREMGFLRRVWVQFTQPEKLRRTPA